MVRKPRGERRRLADQALEIERLAAAVAAPVMARAPGSHHIVVANAKGGTGKTTSSALLALQLAENRGELVAVVDANPHMGTLRRRLVPASVPPPESFIDLCYLAEDDSTPAEWAVLAPYTDMVSRLRVLSNQTADPVSVEELSGAEYAAGIALLRRAAQIVISDMGTSFAGGPAVAALESASTLVFATDLSQDSLELTIEMVSALAGNPLSYRPDPDDWSAVSNGRFAPLVRGSIVAVSPGRGDRRDPEHLAELIGWLRSVCGGGVFVIPKDPHLVRGDLIMPKALQPTTTISYLGIAAAIAARFPVGSED
jgi:MinD-like ATPase involved in chromosome partitioning or flagellar assembly